MSYIRILVVVSLFLSVSFSSLVFSHEGDEEGILYHRSMEWADTYRMKKVFGHVPVDHVKIGHTRLTTESGGVLNEEELTTIHAAIIDYQETSDSDHTHIGVGIFENALGRDLSFTVFGADHTNKSSENHFWMGQWKIVHLESVEESVEGNPNKYFDYDKLAVVEYTIHAPLTAMSIKGIPAIKFFVHPVASVDFGKVNVDERDKPLPEYATIYYTNSHSDFVLEGSIGMRLLFVIGSPGFDKYYLGGSVETTTERSIETGLNRYKKRESEAKAIFGVNLGPYVDFEVDRTFKKFNLQSKRFGLDPLDFDKEATTFNLKVVF